MKRKIISLKENHMFAKTYNRGICQISKMCAVYVLKNYKKEKDGRPQKTKLGITVNRKLGGACKRNRVKRMIREAYRQNMHLIPDGFIIVVAARSAAFAPQVKTQNISGNLCSVLSGIDFNSINKNGGKK